MIEIVLGYQYKDEVKKNLFINILMNEIEI